MNLVLCALAVYKVAQLLDALSPREAMPWVKLLAVTLISYGAAAMGNLENLLISGLAVATLAGATHTLLRVLTLTGDRAGKPPR
jgi:hypothetical protein